MSSIEIDGQKIGPKHPTYIIAEISANHGQDIEIAKNMIKQAKLTGANAVKLQTYTPDTMTIDSDKDYFVIDEENELWGGSTLYELYEQAYTPWEWHEELFKLADELDITIFSTPFDNSAVDFLDELDVCAYKIASFEASEVNLVEKIAKKGKPVIMSTGVSDLSEINNSVEILRNYDIDFALMHCISVYPAPYSIINLPTINALKDIYEVPVGFSDHTIGDEVPIASVAIGADLIEKHFIHEKELETPDSSFSMDTKFFKEMIEKIRHVEQASTKQTPFVMSDTERESTAFKRSIFAVKDIEKGEKLTSENVRVIRPGHGLEPTYYETVKGMKSNQFIERGEPITWDKIK